MTLSSVTGVPGKRRTRSTLQATWAVIIRTSTGTRVPVPRTWNTIAPRFTVSTRTLSRSTAGAAGFRRESPQKRRPVTRASPAPR